MRVLTLAGGGPRTRPPEFAERAPEAADLGRTLCQAEPERPLLLVLGTDAGPDDEEWRGLPTQAGPVWWLRGAPASSGGWAAPLAALLAGRLPEAAWLPGGVARPGLSPGGDESAAWIAWLAALEHPPTLRADRGSGLARRGRGEQAAAALAEDGALLKRTGRELVLALEAETLVVKDRSQATTAELDDLRTRVAQIEAEALELVTRQGRRLERVDFGDLRRLHPISATWGTDRGTPIDRYYIERFLEGHRADVRGRVLEVKDGHYTWRFGRDAVHESVVVDVDRTNPRATVYADLTSAAELPSDHFDCLILTQVLNIVFDYRAVLREARRVLKPGGVLLVTASALNRISYEGTGLAGDYWRFTRASFERLLHEVFPTAAVEVGTGGNVLTCAAFLYGLAWEELSRSELEADDPWFPLVCWGRAVKSSS